MLFFLVVPLCAVLAFEAVRKVTGWDAGYPARSEEPMSYSALAVTAVVAVLVVDLAVLPHPAGDPAGLLGDLRDRASSSSC